MKRKHDPITPEVIAEIELLVDLLDDANARGFLVSVPQSRFYRPPPAGPFTAEVTASEPWQLWQLRRDLLIRSQMGASRHPPTALITMAASGKEHP